MYVAYCAKRKLRRTFLEILKYTLNGKRFESEDEMTNLGEHNFTLNTFKFVSIKWKFFIFSEKQKLR